VLSFFEVLKLYPHEGFCTAVHIYPPSVDAFWTYGVSSCNVLLLFFMARSVPIFVMHYMRMMQLMLPASLPYGIKFICFPFILLLCWWIPFLQLASLREAHSHVFYPRSAGVKAFCISSRPRHPCVYGFGPAYFGSPG
jgi:hypothetical protein